MQERYTGTSLLVYALILLGDWMACLAMATPEVSHLPAGAGCYLGEVKY